MSFSDVWCLPSVDNTWRDSRRNLTMLKWDWRRVDFPQWLSVLICLAITETCDGLHLSTTTTHASTSELEPLTWNSRIRSPGILWFKCIHPRGQGSLLLTFNCFGRRMWHLCTSSFWNVYIEVLIDPAQWLISPPLSTSWSLTVLCSLMNKDIYQTRERQWTVLQVATRREMRIVRSFQSCLVDLWRQGILYEWKFKDWFKADSFYKYYFTHEEG
jgi:hypothetical protein